MVTDTLDNQISKTYLKIYQAQKQGNSKNLAHLQLELLQLEIRKLERQVHYTYKNNPEKQKINLIRLEQKEKELALEQKRSALGIKTIKLCHPKLWQQWMKTGIYRETRMQRIILSECAGCKDRAALVTILKPKGIYRLGDLKCRLPPTRKSPK